VNFEDENRRVEESLLRRFAGEYSPSVQRTLYRMGKAAWESAGDGEDFTPKIPNEHYFLFDLSAFELENENEMFYLSKATFGDIEATVSRS
jgi:urate oxidase